MPFPITFRQHNYNTCKLACYSVAFGLFAFLLFITSTLVLMLQHRNEYHDKVTVPHQNDIHGTFDQLIRVLLPLTSKTQEDCDSIRQEIARRAASNGNIQAIMLVNNGQISCSSTNSNVHTTDIAVLSPKTNTDTALDISVLTVTPDKHEMMIWLKDPQLPHSGVLTILNIALSDYLSFATHQTDLNTMTRANTLKVSENRVQPFSHLTSFSDSPLRIIAIPGLPFTLLLYGKPILADDLTLVLLAGMLIAALTGYTFFMLLSRHLRPGREILQGIRQGNFHVVYQPVITTKNGKISCIEALLRWSHPDKGNIPPDWFISYAESTNLMGPLTRHLFELVTRDSQILFQALPNGTGLSLNISPNHLAEDSFCTDVSAWLKGMPQNHFNYVFEITERSILDDSSTKQIFNWIHNQGIRIAVDDFGTGHSALIYLNKFNFDYLKIDRGFIEHIDGKTVHSPVLEAVLTMASKLGMFIVAEGVETSEQATWLIRRGVSHLQGYLFSRPCTVPQLLEYLQQDQSGLLLS